MKDIIDCPAERAVYFIGGKWKIRILFNLSKKKKVRFGELKRNLKTITQQMLSKQLKELEQDGIVNRKVHQIVPPKVEYSLTEFGNSLIPILRSLAIDCKFDILLSQLTFFIVISLFLNTISG